MVVTMAVNAWGFSAIAKSRCRHGRRSSCMLLLHARREFPWQRCCQLPGGDGHMIRYPLVAHGEVMDNSLAGGWEGAKPGARGILTALQRGADLELPGVF